MNPRLEKIGLTFLVGPAEYNQAIEAWGSWWSLVTRKTSQRWWSVSRLGFEMEGNPILHALSPDRKKGIRIVQHLPIAGEIPGVIWWGDRYIHTDELVMMCSLSGAALGAAADVFGIWLESSCRTPSPLTQT